MQSLLGMGRGGCGGYQEYPYDIVQGLLSSSTDIMLSSSVENSSAYSTISQADEKAAAANKSHSEAERRRRRRINGHLATLRTLVPNTIKTDKASLLAEVVRCLRELKQKTEEVNDCSETNYVVPTETDELKLRYCRGTEGEQQVGMIEATLCCEDRPQMMVEITKAVNSVGGRVVRAEMATIGGRTKNVVWVRLGFGGGEEERLVGLRRALKVVMDNNNNNSTLLPPHPHHQALLGSKRPRLFHS